MPQDPEETIATRTTLIARLKNWQDQSSWQDFFDTYWQLIYGVARKCGLTDQEAQDAVQETMISVAKHMPNFNYDRSLGSFRAWLLNMTRWRITDQFRKRSRAASHSQTEQTTIGTSAIDRIMDPTDSRLSVIWDEEWEKNLVETALATIKRKVDPRRYQIFDFCVNKGWPAEKVAAAFGIEVDDVYQAKFRISAAIKREVNRLKDGLS